MELAAAIQLLRSAGRILERVDDPHIQAYGVLAFALGHTLNADMEAAEPTIRRALAMAEHLDDDALVTQLLGMLEAAAAMRFDAASSSAVLDALRGRLEGEHPSAVRDRERLMVLLATNDVVAARAHAEEMVERWAGIPAASDHVVFALGLLVILDGILRDGPAAARRMAVLEGLIAAEQTTGHQFGVWALEWMRPVVEAFVALAQGDNDRYSRVRRQRHDQLVGEGAGLGGSPAGGTLGLNEHWSGRPWSAIEWLLPANLGLLQQMSSLPSSAERAALRTQVRHGIAPRFAAVAATGDARLLSELIEAMRA